MLRKWGAFVLLLLTMPALAYAQSTGKLAGTVTDAATGEPLPGANVVLVGTNLGTAADVDGNYFIIGVPVGVYDVQASFVGFQSSTVTDVEISSGYTREINFELAEGTELAEIVVEYERPLIQKDAIGNPKVLSSEDIENLPVRGSVSIAALQGGVINDGASNDLFVRGGREEQVSYYVDGVKVIGGVNSLGVPQQAIQEQEMLIGSIPARYGDAQSGVISITTKSGVGAQSFFGSFEAITSEVLDAYGYNLFSGSIGGPLVANKLSFFASGQASFNADASPFAIQIPQLNSATQELMQQTPQGIRIVDAEGNIDYVPLPRDIQPGTLEQIASQLNIPAGFGLADTSATTLTPVSLANFLSPSEFEFVDSKDYPSSLYDFTGNVTFNPVPEISVRLGGTFAYNQGQTYSYAGSLFNPDNFQKNDRQTWRGYLSFRQYLSSSTFYQVQVDYTDDHTWNYPNAYSRDVEDALFYGDIDTDVNALLRSYRNLTATGETTEDGQPIYAYNSRRVDGDVSAGTVDAGTFQLPGQVTPNYSKGHNNQFRLSASAVTQVGLHQLEFGMEYEQRVQRFFSINGRYLAQYYADDNVEIGQGVTSYGDLPYEAFRSSALWYGYDFRGLNEVDNEDIGAFTSAGLSGSVSDYNVAPYSPIYYAGYLSDKIEYRDIVLSLGLRVDVFDNNAPVLADDLALAPIIRVSDLSGVSVPSNIGSDFAVFFDGDEVTGYRDGYTYYDARGQEVTSTEITGRQVAKPGASQFSEEIFADSEPQVTFMPRIGVSFPVTDRALFFASYNVTSQRPSEQAFTPFTSYEAITGQNRLSNPNLKPEKTTQYEIGFRQAVGSRAALQISGFYRKQDNLIQVRDVPAAFPAGMQTFLNVDFATTKGAEFEFDLRRTNNVALRANYTLSFAQGTGSDASSLGVIAWRSSLGGYSPNFISPTTFDQRHSINVSVDYRLGDNEGPRVGDAYLLENFGFNIVGQLGSGMPYTALSYNPAAPFIITDSFTANVEGSINGERMPWNGILNLRVDRRFALGGSSLTAFLWVQNLLNTDNVLGVYRATGLSHTDGYLDSVEGRRVVENAGLADPAGSEAYEFYYRNYVDAPTGIGGNHYSGGARYSLPRRVRLGVRLNF